jgi:hypothetical protein
MVSIIVQYEVRMQFKCELMNDRKRLSLVEDFNVGGVSLWELGQVILPFRNCSWSQGLDYFYELL